MAKITASHPGQWIDALFPEAVTEIQMETWKNIWWRVALMYIPPRHSRFEYELNMGMAQIDAVLNHEPLNMSTVEDGGQHIMFVFPERWLSTQEEYMFVGKLEDHPQIKKATWTIIDLVTKSPFMVGNFIKEDIRICREE